jgi:hypothetical protein
MVSLDITKSYISESTKAAFVVIYYGHWPWFWSLWAETVAANLMFEFLVITDLPKPSPVPSNVRFIKMPMDDLFLWVSF